MKLEHTYFENEIKEIDEFREKLNWMSIENIDVFLIELKQYMFDATMTVKEWEEDNKNIIEVLGESYNLIDTLAGANPWCDEVEDKVNDGVNQIVHLKRKLGSDNVENN